MLKPNMPIKVKNTEKVLTVLICDLPAAFAWRGFMIEIFMIIMTKIIMIIITYALTVQFKNTQPSVRCHALYN